MSRAFPSLLLLAAVAAGACGPTPSPSPASPASPAASGPAATAAPVSPAATPGTSVVGRHADPALEALLPETLGTVALTRESQRGTELSQASPAMTTFLDGLGKTLDDFTLASAYSSTGDIEAQVGAWRIKGAETAKLLPLFEAAIQASSTTKLTMTPMTLEARAITQIGAPGELTQGPLYAYAKDDMLLFVQTTDPAIAQEALGKLP